MRSSYSGEGQQRTSMERTQALTSAFSNTFLTNPVSNKPSLERTQFSNLRVL